MSAGSASNWSRQPSVALGLVFVATHGLSPTTTVLAGRHRPEPPVALCRIFEPALIPLALFGGMLRYRIWDIERLVSRTVVYAAATTLRDRVQTFVDRRFNRRRYNAQLTVKGFSVQGAPRGHTRAPGTLSPPESYATATVADGSKEDRWATRECCRASPCSRAAGTRPA